MKLVLAKNGQKMVVSVVPDTDDTEIFPGTISGSPAEVDQAFFPALGNQIEMSSIHVNDKMIKSSKKTEEKKEEKKEEAKAPDLFANQAKQEEAKPEEKKEPVKEEESSGVPAGAYIPKSEPAKESVLPAESEKEPEMQTGQDISQNSEDDQPPFEPDQPATNDDVSDDDEDWEI